MSEIHAWRALQHLIKQAEGTDRVAEYETYTSTVCHRTRARASFKYHSMEQNPGEVDPCLCCAIQYYGWGELNVSPSISHTKAEWEKTWRGIVNIPHNACSEKGPFSVSSVQKAM